MAQFIAALIATMRVVIRSCRPIWLSTAILLSLLVCGCTIVRVEGGNASWSVHPGLLRIEPRPDAELLVVRTEGIGISPGVNGVSIGYLNQTFAWAYNGSRCQVIIFTAPNREEDTARLAKLLAEVPQVCRVGAGENENISR